MCYFPLLQGVQRKRSYVGITRIERNRTKYQEVDGRAKRRKRELIRDERRGRHQSQTDQAEQVDDVCEGEPCVHRTSCVAIPCTWEERMQFATKCPLYNELADEISHLKNTLTNWGIPTSYSDIDENVDNTTEDAAEGRRFREVIYAQAKENSMEMRLVGIVVNMRMQSVVFLRLWVYHFFLYGQNRTFVIS